MTTVMRAAGASAGGTTRSRPSTPDESARAARLARLASQSPDGLVRTDLNGVLTELNAAVERLLGWRPDVLRGRALSALAHPDDRPAIDACVRRLAAPGGRTDERLTFLARRLDARYSWVEMTLRAECDPAGRPVGVFGAVREVGEWRPAAVIGPTAGGPVA
jgi:PAS domain S-box-containing protein